jgi:hypothetical protein
LNNKNNKIYCGPNCVAKAKYRRARGLPPNGGDKLCSRCGQFFIPKNSKVQICSDNCRKANRLDTYKKCLYGSTGVQEAPPRGLYRTTPVSSVYDILCKRWQMLFNAANPELKKVMQEVERRVPLC